MAINNSKQSNLEKKGAEERKKEIVRSDYNKSDAYSEQHIDAISNPNDETKYLGKGTESGGHTYQQPTDYSAFKPNLDTTNGGGAYDIHGRNGQSGRNRLIKINIYNKENAYGVNSVDTSANIEDGQYVMKG